MLYDFLYKNIGPISQELTDYAEDLIDKCKWNRAKIFDNQIFVNVIPDITHSKRLQELLYKDLPILPGCLRLINFANLPAKTYVSEHKDNTYAEDDFHKIHIPIRTNEGVGMMWRVGFREADTNLITMQKLNAYLVNTTIPHSIVNLSDEDRYFLTVRIEIGGLTDKSITYTNPE